MSAVSLSVIIPVYRVEQTLNRCVESVLRQGVEGMEVILVDDGSPDGCPALCDEWARRDGRITVVHKANGGLSDARNAGLDVARGEIIAFADSDDYVEEGTYAQALAAMDLETDIVEFPVSRWHGSRRQSLLSFSDEYYDSMEYYWLRGHAYEHCYAWNKLYRRSLFRGVRFPVGRVFEDVYILPPLLGRCRSVRTIPRGLYYYCDNAAGITATARGPQLEDLLNAHLTVLPRWQDDRYYMHVLNVQIDVARLTRQKPLLPLRCVSPLAKGLSMAQRVKAALLRVVGVRGLCRIFSLPR